MRTTGTTDPLPREMVDAVREQLARSGATLTPDVVARALRDQGRPVGDATVLAVHDLLRHDVLGAGPLEPLLRLTGVTDVLVNGAEAVYVDRGSGLELTATRFPDDAAVSICGVQAFNILGPMPPSYSYMVTCTFPQDAK